MLARSAAGLRAVELAAACDVDRRTVYRDLSLLNELGIPIEQRDGRFCLNRESYRAPLRLSGDEAVTLLIAAAALSTHPDIQTPALTAAIDQLSQIIPESIGVHAGYLQKHIEGRRAFRNAIFEVLTRAWIEQRRTTVWYISRDGTKIRPLELHLYFIEPRVSGSVYLVGYDSGARRVRALKLSRVRRVELLSTTYQIPPHFDPRPYLERLRPLAHPARAESVSDDPPQRERA
jgi:proteasome accessory factor B